MKILYVEPFYAGAHRQWIDNLKYFSKHDFTILSLPGRKWKWRMHGGAISLAEKFNQLDKKFDLVICSDMLNVPVFKQLCNNNLLCSKVVVYFHENQLSYPWSPHDEDKVLNRDFHYYYINYTSSLISDYNFFNSRYQYDSYFDELKRYLNKMPDCKNLDSIDKIKKKSSVLHVGCNLDVNNKFSNNNSIPIILWNHRWEYDKGPDDFFDTLYKIKKMGIKFSLVVLGEKYTEYPDCFKLAETKLKDEILYMGYCESNKDYKNWLRKADVIPVTSIQDFFGISIVEAISYHTYPILPNRLAYPEIMDIDSNPEIFYNSKNELYKKLLYYLKNYKKLNQSCLKYSSIVNKYSWNNIIDIYDSNFEKLLN